jgi:hypothetical protein
MKFFDLIVVWKKQVSSNDKQKFKIENNLLAEAINRSFNEIKSYVENRRHNLLQSLKTTKDYKLKVLNDQLNLILSIYKFFEIFN